MVLNDESFRVTFGVLTYMTSLIMFDKSVTRCLVSTVLHHLTFFDRPIGLILCYLLVIILVCFFLVDLNWCIVTLKKLFDFLLLVLL